MILELDWMNVSSASNDIRRNGGNIVGVGSHARQISQEPLPKLARTLFHRNLSLTLKICSRKYILRLLVMSPILALFFLLLDVADLLQMTTNTHNIAAIPPDAIASTKIIHPVLSCHGD